MEPKRWAQIEETFQAALNCPSGVSVNFVKEKCPADAKLRGAVETIPDRYKTNAAFLESSV